MKNTYRFERIPHLRLLDLKAQKKGINCKRFMDIPLTFEETIASKIAQERIATTMSALNDKFIIKKQRNHKMSNKKVKQLATPKTIDLTLNRSQSSYNLDGLITKCDKLKSQLLTNKKLSKFQKDASKCYEYLFELSNFNFQKYERN